MSPIEFAARTFSFRTDDGRYVFRPWGSRGPCYLLSHKQRTVRACIQLVFYALLVVIIAFVPRATSNAAGVIALVVGGTVFNWVLYLVFSLGLPTTEKPPPATREQRRNYMVAHSQTMGRPLLWVGSIVSWLFALVGAATAIFGNERVTGVFVLLFFGACGASFIWQLRLLRKR